MQSLRRWETHTVAVSFQTETNSIMGSLGQSTETMRVQIMRFSSTNRTVAFLYDPIFAENPVRNKSFLLCWGLPDMNEEIEKYILRYQAEDPTFHTFTFPLKEVCKQEVERRLWN